MNSAGSCFVNVLHIFEGCCCSMIYQSLAFADPSRKDVIVVCFCRELKFKWCSCKHSHWQSNNHFWVDNYYTVLVNWKCSFAWQLNWLVFVIVPHTSIQSYFSWSITLLKEYLCNNVPCIDRILWYCVILLGKNNHKNPLF